MSIQEDVGIGLINILPNELIQNIFKYLPVETLLVCEEVCERWKNLTRDIILWKNFLIIYSGKPGQEEESEKILQIINTHGEFISRLKIRYVYCYPLLQSIMKKCVNLISMELIMCRIGKEFEIDLKQWTKLQKIDLKNSLLLNDIDMEIQYDNFKNLNTLSLSDFGLSLINCNTLLKCNNLCHIIIEKIQHLNVEFIKEILRNKREILQTFHIYGGDAVDDDCLHLMSQCGMLQDLAIRRCENLTDAGLLALKNLKQIQLLQIWNNENFSEKALRLTLQSPSFVKLQALSLSRIKNISPVIVDVISQHYINLKFLALYQCRRIIHTDYEMQLKSKFSNIEVILY